MSTSSSNRTIHYILWVAQVLLAAAFGMSGFMKITTPIDQLLTMMPWAADNAGLVRFIGVSEILGAIGLILPAALRVMPKLTPTAALGLGTIMVLAAAFHASRGEFSSIGANATLLILALFIAWGRFSKAPVSARA